LPTLNEVNGQKPREIAARVLGQRATAPNTLKICSNAPSRPPALSPADRGLAHELVFGVVRWQATLDWLIARKTAGRPQKQCVAGFAAPRPLPDFLARPHPRHAAVHETVEQAKRTGFGPQAGFINAVLRGYLREADETRRQLDALKTSQPALGYSHPEWLVTRWQTQFGPDRCRQLLEWNNTPPKTFARLNLAMRQPRRHPDEKLRHGVPEKILRGDRSRMNVEYDFVTRDWIRAENLAFELKSHPPLAALESFQKGWFYVQDPSTLLAGRELNPQPGESILDLCAAPGGKTTFIAQLLNNEGRIVAHDPAPDRLKRVEENCRRLGVTCVQTTSTLDGQPSTFDRVLVDAPCSNTGVMRRRVDLRWRIQPAELERLRATQLSLLHQAASKLKSGGTLIYSTCSLEPEENSQLVQQFLAAQPKFKLENERQLLPFADEVDGAYVARLIHRTAA
jgi:16S rRNA (cytosine967-C5)-methyltransferase